MYGKHWICKQKIICLMFVEYNLWSINVFASLPLCILTWDNNPSHPVLLIHTNLGSVCCWSQCLLSLLTSTLCAQVCLHANSTWHSIIFVSQNEPIGEGQSRLAVWYLPAFLQDKGMGLWDRSPGIQSLNMTESNGENSNSVVNWTWHDIVDGKWNIDHGTRSKV